MAKTTDAKSGTQNISFVVEGEFTPTYNIPDSDVETFLERIGAEAVSQVTCGRGSDTWHRQGSLYRGNSYYLLNPDEEKLRNYLAGCQELDWLGRPLRR